MLNKAPVDSGSRERVLSWLFEELQLDEVMVFVAKLETFLVVCGICSVTTVAVGLLPSLNSIYCNQSVCLVDGSYGHIVGAYLVQTTQLSSLFWS